MDKYYYFVAQLPYLYFAKETIFTATTFLEEGEKWLSPSDFTKLKTVNLAATEKSASDPQVLKEYKEFETQLRHELKNWRIARRKQQEYKLKLFSPALIRDENPLHAEINLVNLRWQYIEELEFSHHFDLQFVILYYLKLQLLQRLSTFNKEKGMKKFKQFIETGL